MASDNNLPPIIGTYNGINYYMQDGKQRQRKAGGGFTTESIKNNPNMQEIRNGNKELALCSKFNKNFKEAMYPFFNELNDGTLHKRLMKLFMKILTLDVAPKGKRLVGNGLCCDNGKKLLREFKYTASLDARDVLGPSFNFNAEAGTLKTVAFYPKRLRFPKGSTHFSIDYGLLEYDLKANKFLFILNDNTLMVHKEDEVRELLLEIPEKPKERNIVFGVLKLQYYMEMSGQLHKSFAKGALSIGFF